MPPGYQNFGCAFLLVRRSPAPSRKSFSRNSSNRFIPSTAHRNAAEFATIATAQRSRTVLSAGRCRASKLAYRSNGVRQPDSRSQRGSERRLFSRARRSEAWQRCFCSGRSARATRFRSEDRGPDLDVINVAGKKVNPAEVEANLLRFKGVRQAVVFGRPTGAGLRNEEVAACVRGIAGRVSESDSFTILPHCIERMAGAETNLYRRHNSDKRARQNQQTRACAAFSGRDGSSPLRTLAS